MKKILYSVYIFSIFSCSNFTDVGVPSDQITTELVFKDEALANAAMAGVYNSLQLAGFLCGSSSGSNVSLACYTDELNSLENPFSDLSQFFLLTHNASNSFVGNLWATTYNQIYNVNAIIEGLEKSNELDTDFKNRLLGEALVIRAILHLYLTSTFGDIPIVTTTFYPINNTVTRSSQIEVYTQVRNDLTKAEELLPSSLPPGNRSRPTKVVAKALLARIAYFEKDWDTAIFYSSQVIDQPGYSIENNIDNTFLLNSSSAIWQLLPVSGYTNTQEASFFIPLQAPPPSVALTTSFLDGFEEGDLRKVKWVGEIVDKEGIVYSFPFKYKEYSNTAPNVEYSVLLRIEEMYLIRAEAYIQHNQFSLGKVDLNVIRNRVDLPNILSNDRDILLGAVLQERRYELFTEFGHRFEDLKHAGKLNEQMITVKPNWSNHFQWWPLPENELTLNPNLNPQNEGY